MKTLLDREDLVFNPPELGCVLYLPGLPGGGSKIYDRSPYGRAGTITGATWKRLPSGLWYLSFDGSDDYVNCGSMACSDPLTIKAWINIHTLKGGGAIHVNAGIVHLGATGLHYYGRSAASGGENTLTFHRPGVVQIYPIADILSADIWYHVVCTKASGDINDTNVDIYLDTVSLTLDALDGSGAPNYTGDTWVGRQGTDYFPGSSALVEVLNGIWSALDVQNSFNREKHLFGVW